MHRGTLCGYRRHGYAAPQQNQRRASAEHDSAQTRCDPPGVHCSIHTNVAALPVSSVYLTVVPRVRIWKVCG